MMTSANSPTSRVGGQKNPAGPAASNPPRKYSSPACVGPPGASCGHLTGSTVSLICAKSPDLSAVIDPSPGAAETIAGVEFLDVYMPMLPEDQQRVLLRYAQGDSPTQIAVGEGVTRQTVHNRLNAGIRQLRFYARR